MVFIYLFPGICVIAYRRYTFVLHIVKVYDL